MKGKNLINRLTDEMRILEQPLPGVPIVEIADCGRVLIENHKGIRQYQQDRIQVCVRYGFLTVTGSCLEITVMTKHKLVILGSIHSVTLERCG